MNGRILKKIVSMVMLVIFIITSVPSSFAQMAFSAAGNDLGLSAPGTMVDISAAFQPAALMGMKVYPNDPFRFDFLVDKGDFEKLGTQGEDENTRLETESSRLLRYFLAALTTPEKDMWVNLSPYEGDRIIPDSFSLTEMGRDLLEQDYILKQLSSSLMYPEKAPGKDLWRKIYAAAFERYGTTDIPIDTFNKVWITPDEATVYVNGQTALIKSSHLKVMLESDYLAAEKSQETLSKEETETKGEVAKAVIREVVIPIIEKEVNEGAHFARLRQIYHGMVLATWFKRNLKESLVGRIYVDRNKVKGIDLSDVGAKDKIWRQYVEAFQKGVFNYIKEEQEEMTGELIPRKYFSGGIQDNSEAVRELRVSLKDMAAAVDSNNVVVVEMQVNPKEASPFPRVNGDVAVKNTQAIPLGDQERVNALSRKLSDEFATNGVEEKGQLLAFFMEQNEEGLLTADAARRTGWLAQVAAVLRNNYPYDMRTKKDIEISETMALGPLAYAIKTNRFFKIGPDLYISPATGSFRRHLIFKTDEKGNVIFAVEFMMPGDKIDSQTISAKKRQRIAEEIGEKRSVQILETGEFSFTGTLYNENKSLSKKMEVAFFDYEHRYDGTRLTNVTDAQKKAWKKQLGLSSMHELDRRIAQGAIQCFLKVRQLGYIGGADIHLENFRGGLALDEEGKLDVKIQLVGDFQGYKTRKSPAVIATNMVALAMAGAMFSHFSGLHAVPTMVGQLVPTAFLAAFWPINDYLTFFMSPVGYRSLASMVSLTPAELSKEYVKASQVITESLQQKALMGHLLSSVALSVGVGGIVVGSTFLKLLNDEKTGPALSEDNSENGSASVNVLAVEKDFKKGGIDLNADKLRLNETGQRLDLSGLADPTVLEKSIVGLVPVIFSITPLNDPQSFFGTLPT